MTEYLPEAGYAIDDDFEIKYYTIEAHLNNPNRISNRNGSSGIRFYLGDQLRQYDIGYLTFGTDQSSAWDGMGRKKSSHGTSEMSNIF
ncbi:unnamed protein product [Rotaria magnacalcarata]|nr:unnamed protein product [Rotaria magnacalcarata]CAF1645490.1 unnamed protein product [Rotaria magnacalcarata]CAF1957652.1 unnamed protein product [Rotaria magnacalcarata]CAF4342717.1 unnamed protein product [Rotaria magnacalcarata]